MEFQELVQAMQTLNAEDAFRPRLTFDQWRVVAPYLTQHDIRSGDLPWTRPAADSTLATQATTRTLKETTG